MLEIDLLGPFRVLRDDTDVTPSAPKLRQVLALLVLNANSMLGIDQLCGELWGDCPPQSAMTTIQTYIYQLRRRLRLATGQTGAPFASCPPSGRPALITRVGGYELQVEDKRSIDAFRFEQLVKRGRDEERNGAGEQAVRTLQEALDLWQGRALIGVAEGERLSAWSTQLEERRRGVLEKRFSIELELGRHRAVLDELSDAFRSYPIDEALAGQLMQALHLCGRRPEALEVFRTLRSRLVDDLGLEPSERIQRMHQEVLADAGAAKAARTSTTMVQRPLLAPAQLPAEAGDFVGREAEISQLDAYLAGSGAVGTRGTRVVEIHGAPGIGKTDFAIHAAHRVRRHFPDGQLYVDLSELREGGSSLTDMLKSTLSALGLRRDRLPTGLDELSRLLRSLTADRQVLIVVDEVIAASQMRAFIPGGSGCAVIATHRYRAHSLGVGRKIALSTLDADDSRRLYNRVAEGRRWQDEPAAVRELLRMCGGLPLVIRAVAGRLASRPGWSAARLLERLRHNESALLALPAGTKSLVSTIGSSYSNLPAQHRCLLHLLIEGEQTDWHIDEAAKLLSLPELDAETLLEELVDLHLVDEQPAAATGPVPDAEPVYTVPRLTKNALLLLRTAHESLEAEPLNRSVAIGPLAAHPGRQ